MEIHVAGPLHFPELHTATIGRECCDPCEYKPCLAASDSLNFQVYCPSENPITVTATINGGAIPVFNSPLYPNHYFFELNTTGLGVASVQDAKVIVSVNEGGVITEYEAQTITVYPDDSEQLCDTVLIEYSGCEFRDVEGGGNILAYPNTTIQPDGFKHYLRVCKANLNYETAVYDVEQSKDSKGVNNLCYSSLNEIYRLNTYFLPPWMHRKLSYISIHKNISFIDLDGNRIDVVWHAPYTPEIAAIGPSSNNLYNGSGRFRRRNAGGGLDSCGCQ